MLIGALVIILILLLLVAWRHGWDWRATGAALLAFVLALWEAFSQVFGGSVPSP